MASWNNIVDLTGCDDRSYGSSSSNRPNYNFAKLRRWEDVGGGNRSMPGVAFRIMSYNILSQILLETHSYLYQDCHSDYLGWDFRFPKIYKEIIAQNADVVCLQELQYSHVESFVTVLKNHGYKHIYKQRTGIRVDGCAIFYKAGIFDLVDFESVEFLQPSTDILDRDNIGLIAKFRLKIMPSSLFVVATTHLLYNPKRIDVRLAQVQVFLAEIDRFAYYMDMSTKKTQHLPVIITGDFNSDPTTPVTRLLLDGFVKFQQFNSGLKNIAVTDSSQHLGVYLKRKKGINVKDEDLSMLYHSERKPEESSEEASYQSDAFSSLFNKGQLKHTFKLNSAYSFGSPDQWEATTHQDMWLTVDYVLYSSGNLAALELLEHYRLPTVEECENMGQIPNKYFGSDHFSLGAGFRIVPQVPHSSV